ncbi:hypothetical protein N7490_009111 [Penicillium lividum]|nr:hypothetical protein N7490_009111 [Penicillium lividum]
MAPMERILIESEIKSLLVRERYYRDTCQWEKLRACYHPNALNTHIEITWFQGNIDGFVSGSKGMATGGTGAVHTICPIETHVHGNKALSESTGSIAIRFQHHGGLFDCVSYTRFISRLEVVNGEWKLLTLDAIYERDSIMPVVPGTVAEFFFLRIQEIAISVFLGFCPRKGSPLNMTFPELMIRLPVYD